MRIAIDGKSARMGGAKTYLMNFLPDLRDRLGPRGHQFVVWRNAQGTGDQNWPEGVEYRDYGGGAALGKIGRTIGRVWLDQVTLPRQLRKDGADVLFSTANFGPLRCPCRQVLLVRNAAYFDRVFLARMSAKIQANYALQRWLTLRSMAAADVVLFPSQAMLDLVAGWAGGSRPDWGVAHYGIRHDLFRPAAEPEPGRGEGRPFRILNVSHYSDQKNFGTLMSAVEQLDRAEPGRFHLSLTAGFEQSWLSGHPFFPNFDAERDLYRRLHGAGLVDDADWTPYSALPAMYRSSDLFVFSSYIESFGHPLVEAMATGLPIVAADTPVNRELCGEAAEYFAPPFDVGQCAAAIRRVADDPGLQQRMRAIGLTRARQFHWGEHASQLARVFEAG